MIDFKEEIAKKIAEVVQLDKNELMQYIEIPPNAELGDYAFPCFKLAKTLRKAPPMIATEIKENIAIDGEIIEKIDVVGGYLNIYINKETLIKTTLGEVASKKEEYGSSNLGDGKNIVIEYSSPNIAKPFHIGHLRTTVIGGALYKIYKFLGYNVIGINYLGDWGMQFGKVLAGLNLWGNEYDFENNKIQSLLNIYVRYCKEEKNNSELTELARECFKKLEEKDEEALKKWEWIRNVSIENYNKTYSLLNIHFDEYRGEA